MFRHSLTQRRFAKALLLCWLLLTVMSCGAFASVADGIVGASEEMSAVDNSGMHSAMPCCDTEPVMDCCDAAQDWLISTSQTEKPKKPSLANAEMADGYRDISLSLLGPRSPPSVIVSDCAVVHRDNYPRLHVVHCTFLD